MPVHAERGQDMKTIIHVNQHNIKKNKRTGSRDPVITCKTYKTNVYAHEAVILDKDGREVARVVYRPDKPLSCGAHVWIETLNEVVTITTDSEERHVLAMETGS